MELEATAIGRCKADAHTEARTGIAHTEARTGIAYTEAGSGIAHTEARTGIAWRIVIIGSAIPGIRILGAIAKAAPRDSIAAPP
jgi:hypothetical protein